MPRHTSRLPEAAPRTNADRQAERRANRRRREAQARDRRDLILDPVSIPADRPRVRRFDADTV